MTEKEIDDLRAKAEQEIFPAPYKYKRGYGRVAAKFLNIKHYTGLILKGTNPDCWPPATDHPAMIYKNGQPHCFVSQPYDFTEKDMAATVEYCKTHKLYCDIKGFSVHYPGMTMMIRYWRDDANSL